VSCLAACSDPNFEAAPRCPESSCVELDGGLPDAALPDATHTPNGGEDGASDDPPDGDAGDVGTVPECERSFDCERGTCELGMCVTVAPRVIAGDATWRAEDSPYYLREGVQVGGVLSIEAGVRVIGNRHRLQLLSGLEVRGTAEARVVLDDLGIDSAGDAARPVRVDIQFALIRGGRIFEKGESTRESLRLRDSILEGTEYLELNGGSDGVEIVRNVFHKGAGFIIVSAEGGLVRIVNNYLDVEIFEADYPFGGAITVWSAERADDFEIAGNTFAQTEQLAVSMTEYSTGGPSAAGNYWSTSSQSVIERMIHDRHDDLLLQPEVPYVPFLQGPHPLTPTPATTAADWPQVDGEWSVCVGEGCCRPSLCEHGGACVEGQDGVSCKCPDGATSEQCEPATIPPSNGGQGPASVMWR